MPLIRKNNGPAQSSPAEPALRDALRAGSADERWSAARSLASEPASAGRLGEALAVETDRNVREAIFSSLARHATLESIDVMIPYIRSDDAMLRTAALDALRATPGPAGERLSALLADPDADVRLLSCDIARALPAEEASRRMCALLDLETEPNVCAAAVDVLAEMGDAAALPVLARCAARFADEAFLGFAIAAASRRIGSQPKPHGG